MKKQLFWKAFSEYLAEIELWSQKKQFSDGVGYLWIDTLKKVSDEEISDSMMVNAHFRFPINTPQTKESFYYRQIFDEHFPPDSAASCVPGGPSVECSTPEALSWEKSLQNVVDPSGRAVQNVQVESY